MSNTAYKYVSRNNRGNFVVSLPPEVATRAGRQRIERKWLNKAVEERNKAFGFDPDIGFGQPDFQPTHLAPVTSSVRRFGALGDTHLTSTQEALDDLWIFYEELKQRGVTVALHTGNLFDSDRFPSEVHTWGLDNKISYVLRNYPQVPGVDTYIITADDHEGDYWKQLGVDPIRTLVERSATYGRDDLHHLGYLEADVLMPLEGGNDVRIKVVHPGGASAQSISHSAQKILDVMTKTETPDILLLGHFHKAHHLPNYRGCDAIQTGSFQRQTTFMRKKPIYAALGGWVIEVSRGYEGRLRVGASHLHYKPRPWEAATREVVVGW